LSSLNFRLIAQEHEFTGKAQGLNQGAGLQRGNFMRFILMAAAAVTAIGLATPASAAAIINGDGSVTFNTTAGSNTANITYNGLGGDPKALTPGLSAYLTLTLTSVSNNIFTFNYALQNTSTVSGTRVSGIGFNVDPNATGVSSTGVFDQATLGANFASVGAETCFNGGPGACPESNPANSVLFGGTGSGTLLFTLGGPANQTSLTLSNFLDRYQGFSTTNVNQANVTSAIGVGTPGAVPEPATWAMMLLGFAGIGVSMRRRRRPGLAQLA
jgi:hypothetical protein